MSDDLGEPERAGLPATPSRPPLPGARWKGDRPFVGREDVNRFLNRSLEAALLGSGRVAFLYGPPGSGRTRTLRAFAKTAPRRFKGVRSGYGDAADAEHPAWKQLADSFTGVRRALAVLRDTAAGWLGLLPLVGGIIEAILDTWEKLRPRKEGEATRTRLGTGSSVDQVRTLLQHGRQNRRVILLDNLDAADADELAGAFAMVHRLEGTHTLVVITATEHAARAPGPVRDLALEADRLGVGSSFHLPPLSADELARAASDAVGQPLPDAWRDWWADAMDGTPGRLWAVMARLEEAGALRRSRFSRTRWSDTPPVHAGSWIAAAAPGDAAAPLPARDVDDAEAELLASAAAFGERFRSTELARATGADGLELDDRLAVLARRSLIRLVETREEDGELFDVYEFLPPGGSAWRRA